jgi:2-iminobutanoate/2-iminopropanoate deaminase
MTKHAFTSPHAPAAIGPYSQAMAADRLVFLSGQTPLDPQTQRLVEGDVGVQTERALRNLAAVLEAAGLSFANVVRCGVFLTDLADFEAMNAVYATFFSAPYPARTTVGVSALPKGARVEIDCVALRP